jgi:hypothetical protein
MKTNENDFDFHCNINVQNIANENNTVSDIQVSAIIKPN